MSRLVPNLRSIKVFAPPRIERGGLPNESFAARGIGGSKEADTYFVLIACILLFVLLPAWKLLSADLSVFVLAFVITTLGIWHAYDDHKTFKGLTFSSTFTLVSAFVFGARAFYIYFNDDFTILDLLSLPKQMSIVSDAMGCATLGLWAFVLGARMLRRRALNGLRSVEGRIAGLQTSINLSPVYFYAQAGVSFLLLPLALLGDRGMLLDGSNSAYVYLLPTLAHGFDLYFFTHASLKWQERGGVLNFGFLVISGLFVISHAYLLSNLSPFRGYFLVGLLACGISFLRIYIKRVGIWVGIFLFAIYPIFKAIGTDRTLSNKELIQDIVLNPAAAYSGDGIEAAFGAATDINMLDTLAASLNWDHRFRGYIFSYIYPFVHWIPRAWWPSKPAYGVLSDGGYLWSERLERDIPYSPGIIGFFNDDGGRVYMIIMMFVLGAFIRWWEIVASRVRRLELRHAIWASFFLCAIVSVRYLPYQIFYQFWVFFIPCWLCDRFSVKRHDRQLR